MKRFKKILKAIHDFFSPRVNRVYISAVREMTHEDLLLHREFVMSEECKSVERSLIIRIGERMDVALDTNTNESDRKSCIECIEELKDIMQEWRNIRDDITAETNEKA